MDHRYCEHFPGISLFSGAGGMDLGLESEGIRFRAFVEFERWARETLSQNFEIPQDRIFGDISQVDPDELLRSAGLKRNEVFVVAGGPPCQAFSTAGRRASVHDPRGQMVEQYFRVVDAVQPRFFVFENVRGLLSAAVRHRPIAQRGDQHAPLTVEERLGSVLEDFVIPRFNALGYEVTFGLVDAASYGVPQRRLRVIIMGSRDGEFRCRDFKRVFGRALTITDLMPPSHTSPGKRLHDSAQLDMLWPKLHLPEWRTLADALLDMPNEPPEFMSYSEARRSIFELIPAGQNWRYVRDNPQLFPLELLRQIMGGAYASTGGRVGFWRRLSWDEPSPTVVTSPMQKATGLCHPDETRPLSVQEYKRIQEFPDDFEICGPTVAKYRQLGNAVPVGLAKAVGRTLLRASQGKPWSLDGPTYRSGLAAGFRNSPAGGHLEPASIIDGAVLATD